jgi:hypothetical protein
MWPKSGFLGLSRHGAARKKMTPVYVDAMVDMSPLK